MLTSLYTQGGYLDDNIEVKFILTAGRIAVANIPLISPSVLLLVELGIIKR